MSATIAENTDLLWIDCEMSGLDLRKDVIIEYAAIATNGQLEPYDEGISYVIKTEKTILDGMDDWCTKQHGESGLTNKCLTSPITLPQVDALALEYARRHTPHGRILLAGSSVHVDKAFLKKDFPRLSDHLHYRVLDVSSIKECARRWYPELNMLWRSQGESKHRALDDIRESIEELRRYRQHLFKPASEVTPESIQGHQMSTAVLAGDVHKIALQ